MEGGRRSIGTGAPEGQGPGWARVPGFMRAERTHDGTFDVAAASGLIQRLGAEEDDLDLLGDLLLAQPVALQAKLGGLLLQPVQGALQELHALMVLGRQRGVEHLVQRGEQVVVQELGQECLGGQVEERWVPGCGPGGRFLNTIIPKPGPVPDNPEAWPRSWASWA
jgi:hypothetical protein